MKRFLIFMIAAAGALALARTSQKSAPKAMERMMEKVMPKMMDGCFAQMDIERRRFMLSHCRGMLDQMEEKYVKDPAA